jgi:opacity protein-like surface antigen
MSLKRLAVAVLVALAAFVAQATAQEFEEDWELSGLIGRAFIRNQGTKGVNQVRFGNGLAFEVNYAARMLGGQRFWSLYLEFPVVVNLDEDLNADTSQVPEQFRSYFVTPAARFHLFSNAALSPWVSAGGGFGYFSESSKLLSGTPNGGKTGTPTGVFQAGVGMDVKTFKNVDFRLEARDFWSGVPHLNVNTGTSRQHNIFVSGGIVAHF